MASSTYDRALKLVLKHEGGWSDHPRDPGGATNFGITIGTLSAYRGRPVTKAEVRMLSLAEASAIYRVNYWRPIGAESAPPGYDYTAFDAAVNSGVGRAKKWVAASPVMAGLIPAIRKFNATRLGFLRGLGTFGTFGKGWTRRVAEVEAISVAMAEEAKGTAKEASARHASQEAKDAASRKRGAATTAGGAVTTGGVAGGATDLSGAWTWIEWLVAGGFAVAVIGLIIFAGYRAFVQHERQGAHERVAKALATGKDLSDAVAS